LSRNTYRVSKEQDISGTARRRFRPYPEYKDSGVQWLGKIPTHWGTDRLKYVVTISNERSYDPESALPFKGLEHIESGTGKLLTSTEDGNGEIGEIESSSSHFRPGDILFGKLRPYLAKVLKPDFEGRCSTELIVLRCGGNIDPQNLSYQLLSSGFISWINSMTYGTKMPRANAEQIVNTKVPLAPLPEQHAIAKFLDRETAKIDALIAKKERLIKLLQEKRTALITQAVTKGLDPNVPMKDSGIEWLGKIPAHWEVTTLKRIGDLQAGAGFPDEEQGLDSEDIPFFKVGDMGLAANKKEMIDCPNTISQSTARRLRAYIFPPKTIVFAKVGAALLLNRRRVLSKPSCIDNNMMGFIPAYCDSGWALYWLCGLDLGELANPGAVPSVNEGQMRDTPVVVPLLNEQCLIAAFLDRETAKIDSLVSKVKGAIEHLKEYRTALISAAVAGKIDVRGRA